MVQRSGMNAHWAAVVHGQDQLLINGIYRRLFHLCSEQADGFWGSASHTI
jgi:hypothetical protein